MRHVDVKDMEKREAETEGQWGAMKSHKALNTSNTDINTASSY